MQTQEVDIKPNIKVFMRSDSEMLDEVMVVAYGTAKKSAFTGSASVIKSETLEKRQVSNLSNALSHIEILLFADLKPLLEDLKHLD